MKEFKEYLSEMSMQWMQAKPDKFFGIGKNFEVSFNKQTNNLTLTDKDYKNNNPMGMAQKLTPYQQSGTVSIQLNPEQAEIIGQFITSRNNETKPKMPPPVPGARKSGYTGINATPEEFR